MPVDGVKDALRATLIADAAQAIVRTRVQWGWMLGYKRARVTALDLMMAEAAIDACNAAARKAAYAIARERIEAGLKLPTNHELRRDLRLYGISATKDGQRIDPNELFIEPKPPEQGNPHER